jgi:hypothetical protein
MQLRLGARDISTRTKYCRIVSDILGFLPFILYLFIRCPVVMKSENLNCAGENNNAY